MVWNNIIKAKLDFKHYSLHTKIVLSITAVLLISSTVLFFILEKNKNFAGLSTADKWLHSFFQAVTPRTAGFNTTDLSSLSESSSLLTTVLMLIGGSPGSTAGGIKTTTFVVLFLMAFASSRKNNNVVIFKRPSQRRHTEKSQRYIINLFNGCFGINFYYLLNRAIYNKTNTVRSQFRNRNSRAFNGTHPVAVCCVPVNTDSADVCRQGRRTVSHAGACRKQRACGSYAAC